MSIYVNHNKDVLKIDTKINNSFYPTFIAHYNSTLHAFYKPAFKKIKFRGKGYYIYKNIRNTIAPQLSESTKISEPQELNIYFKKLQFNFNFKLNYTI